MSRTTKWLGESRHLKSVQTPCPERGGLCALTSQKTSSSCRGGPESSVLLLRLSDLGSRSLRLRCQTQTFTKTSADFAMHCRTSDASIRWRCRCAAQRRGSVLLLQLTSAPRDTASRTPSFQGTGPICPPKRQVAHICSCPHPSFGRFQLGSSEQHGRVRFSHRREAGMAKMGGAGVANWLLASWNALLHTPVCAEKTRSARV